MLEQQQSQLVAGLQATYKRLQKAQVWNGPNLAEANGYPLTHDILAALDLLEVKNDGSGEVEPKTHAPTRLPLVIYQGREERPLFVPGLRK